MLIYSKKKGTTTPITKPVGQVKNLNTTTRGIFEYNKDKKKKD